jgi:probable HAF family extracellular repeat protein
MLHQRNILVCGSLLILIAQANLRAAEFQGLGPAGSSRSLAHDVSANGGTVVGYFDTGSAVEAFRWTASEGIVGLGGFPSRFPESVAYGVSGDGSVIVGYSSTDNGREAFRWTKRDGMVGLGDLPGEERFSVAFAVSQDGVVIVGAGDYSTGGGPRPTTGQAFRWSSDDGLVGLADLPGGPNASRAWGVSADGQVIVGKGDAASTFQVEDLGAAVRWSSTSEVERLDGPKDSPFSIANAISANGRVIVGASSGLDASFRRVAVRWVGDEPVQALRVPAAEHVNSEALAVSEDGEVIVGTYLDADFADNLAFIWDMRHGLRSVQEVLSEDKSLSQQLAGWRLREATGVSADGLTIVGSGLNPSGNIEAWIARLEPLVALPGDFNGDGLVGVADMDLLTNEVLRGTHDVAFDLTGDDRVTQEDRTYWIERIARTYSGDSNLDGEFGSSDLVQVFQAGQYEDGIPLNSSWATGDWDGDREFSTSDLVHAFQVGAYESGPRPAEHAVPEPTGSAGWLAIAAMFPALSWGLRGGRRLFATL